MPRTNVRKLYRQLSPEELYRLAVAAAARGDEQDREALVSSCPKMTVTTIGVDFEAALEGTWALLDVAVPSLARYLGWLEALEAVHEPIQEAVAVLVRAPTPSPTDPAPFVVQHLALAHALGLLGAVTTALSEVCAEHDLDSSEVLRVFAPGLAEALESRSEAIGAAEPDAQAQEAYRTLLVRAWAASQP